MKLKKFSIQGFRSLKDLSWASGDLNVLIGPNGSGKSNLLRAMEFLQEAGAGNLDSAIVREGDIGALLWDGHSREIDWRVDIDSGGEFRDFPGLADVKTLRYELCLLSYGFQSGYRIEREMLSAYRDQHGAYTFTCFERSPMEVSILDSKNEKIPLYGQRLEETQTLLAQTSIPFARPEAFAFQYHLKKWKIYQHFSLQQDSEVRKSAVTRRELQLSRTGTNLIAALHTLYSTERDFRIQLIAAMQAAFGKDFEELEFPPAEDQRVQMRIRWRSLKNSHSAADLSEGTLKYLMLIAILANPNRGDLIAIDEPETYLHPSMFPIIAELAAEASKSSQVIFTTHSPEFLTAMGSHNPQTTVLQNIDGETKLNVLDQQEMKRWLEKYKLGELFMSGDLEALV